MKLTILIIGGIVTTASAFQTQSSKLTKSFHHNHNIPTSTITTSLSSSVINIAEDAQRDVGTFDQWAMQCGVQRADGVQITTNDGMDYELITQNDIPANNPVLFVPGNMILSSNLAKQEFGILKDAEKRIVSARAADQVPHFYLFLKILTEFEKGEQSPWFPWLNSLPRYYSNGASMTPFCFDCLPPFAGRLASNERIRYIQFFQSLKFVPFVSDDIKRSKELSKWAYAVVHTRCFEMPDGDVKLVPMADMFNHGADTDVELNYDEEGNCYAYSTYDIPAGYPLRITYADHTNPSRLFARWGFLDYSAPASFCKIIISRPDQKLINMGYEYSKLLFYKDTGEISEQVWDILLYLNLGATDPDQQQAFYDAHMNGDYNTKQQFHQHYFPQTLASLQEHVNNFLGELDQLAMKAQGKSVDEHPRLPLILGHNEFVRETFLRVKSNIDNM